jgi:hypothetical protein
MELAMTNANIFANWEDRTSSLWGNTPLLLKHTLHEHPLFSNEALAALVEDYPREHYNLVQWGSHGESGSWREGELSGISGRDVIDAIAKGRVWINMRNLPVIDARYGDLMTGIFDELESCMPEFKTFTRKLGLLISSPLSRTLYHADLPGQSLWQIRGVKRVFVYPNASPFQLPQYVERIALSGVEVNMPYESWYDQHATVYDIGPGEMLHWPLNAPHRVDNHNCLNVSMTIEYFTQDIRRQHMVTVANAILRSKFGLAPSMHTTTGPAFWTKACLQRALRNSAWVRRAHRPRRTPEFRLDPTRPGGVVDIMAA